MGTLQGIVEEGKYSLELIIILDAELVREVAPAVIREDALAAEVVFVKGKAIRGLEPDQGQLNQDLDQKELHVKRHQLNVNLRAVSPAVTAVIRLRVEKRGVRIAAMIRKKQLSD